jgi:tetratricopeptide (TPR) repeat protein
VDHPPADFGGRFKASVGSSLTEVVEFAERGYGLRQAVNEGHSPVTKILPALVAALSIAAVTHAAEPSEDAAKIVAVSHLKKGQALANEGKLERAEKEFNLAIISYPDGAALYAARGRTRYERKNYPGAIEDFDTYLKANPNDFNMMFLRGIAKSLLKPEDIVGACADFLTTREHTKEVDMGKYCHGQPGWPEK